MRSKVLDVKRAIEEAWAVPEICRSALSNAHGTALRSETALGWRAAVGAHGMRGLG